MQPILCTLVETKGQDSQGARLFETSHEMKALFISDLDAAAGERHADAILVVDLALTDQLLASDGVHISRVRREVRVVARDGNDVAVRLLDQHLHFIAVVGILRFFELLKTDTFGRLM